MAVGEAVPVDRSAIEAELTRCRADLAALLASASRQDLARRSDGTRWSNEQLLFHMVFGFLVVRRLLPIVRTVSRVPPPVGRGFARTLEAARGPFHVVNYLGSCAAALVFDHRRMGWLSDRTIDGLLARLSSESDATLRRTMPFPPSWDPYFLPEMSLADVYAYPSRHYDHHRAQLSPWSSAPPSRRWPPPMTA